MIQLSGAKGVEVKYTGLRPGEKLYEEVLSTQENTIPSFNPKIRIARVREYEYEEVNRQIEELMASGRVIWQKSTHEEFRWRYGAFRLVFAATDDFAANAEVCRQAR